MEHTAWKKTLRDKQRETGNELSILEEEQGPSRPLVQTYFLYTSLNTTET